MKIYYSLEKNLLNSSCIALGFFDGIHIGHQKVINDAVETAKLSQTNSTVISFRNQPRAFFSDSASTLIVPIEKKLKILEEMGVNNVILLDFNEELANLSAEKYVEMLVNSLAPKAITVGFNHHFGKKNEGNNDFLIKMGEIYGYETRTIPAVIKNHNTISSTYIKYLIQNGKVDIANELLYYPYSIENVVKEGVKRGRNIGFPTANLEILNTCVVPSFGVYQGKINLNNRMYLTIVNIGNRPTYSDIETPLAEVHILGFNSDIYGQKIEVILEKKIRNEIKFNSENELIEQINNDIQNVASLANL
ncbi:MAG: bifunctional riboflavin kinase/FAD synthetase [Candidatus Gastranaerophilales bacterium]|nr:bifunctional riboflavin kinase/FAD synthetase [Candidatus Gastranaerophilales bacterium]